MRLPSRALLLMFALPSAASAQVRWPEEAWPRVPGDGGVLSQKLSASFPIVAIASTDAGHDLAWSSQSPETSSLYLQTTLTFLSQPGGGLVRLSDSKGQFAAKGVHRFTWPRPLENWSLSDRGLGDGPGTRRFVLSEHIGTSCPETNVEHWLELRGGRITELLTTRTTGEGVEDSLSVSGSTAIWPSVDAGSREVELPFMKSPLRFPPITDVAAARRVVVFEADIQGGRVCSASRTLYRYADGGLEQVRVEHLDAGCR